MVAERRGGELLLQKETNLAKNTNMYIHVEQNVQFHSLGWWYERKQNVNLHIARVNNSKQNLTCFIIAA